MRQSYEARMLGCTDEEARRAAYSDPEPSENWRTQEQMTPEEEELMRRLKRWNGVAGRS